MRRLARAGRRPSPPVCVFPLVAILASLSGPGALHLDAQVVRGRLLESGSQRPIVLGRVMLLDTAFSPVEETLTDEEGDFLLQAPGPGSYWVAADRLGYEPIIDGVVELEEGGLMPVHLYMRPLPVQLEGLSVTAERRRIERALTRAGFYERQERGFGDFIDLDELELRKPVDMSGVLRSVPSIRSQRGPAGEEFLCNGREPRVFVDGVRIAFPNLAGPDVASNAVIGKMVDVRDLAGVEVYTRPSLLPIQWSGTALDAGERTSQSRRPLCTILIWTRS